MALLRRHDERVAPVKLLVGRSTVVDVGTPIARVSLTSADIADAVVTSPNQLLVNGKTPGTISMFVWERAGGLRRYEIVVQRDLARLTEQMQAAVPGRVDRGAEQRQGHRALRPGLEQGRRRQGGQRRRRLRREERRRRQHCCRSRTSTASNQVLLRVRFAEVSRSAMTELGASLFTGPTGFKNMLGRVDHAAVRRAGSFDNSRSGARRSWSFSDFLNLFLFNAKYQLGAVIKALQTKGLFQSLAEPNLVAESGKEASFLAGGEFPVPVAQGSGANLAITVQYKEFGVRLNFTPVITATAST